MALQGALDQLGYSPGWHLSAVATRVQDVKQFHDLATEGRPVNLTAMLDGFDVAAGESRGLDG